MPHNIGRKFYRCPRADEDERDGCTWIWADGSRPGGAEAQARFRAHVGRNGFAWYSQEQLSHTQSIVDMFFGA